MRGMKSAFFGVVLGCVVFSCPAWGVEIQPSIVDYPDSPGGLFSFDLVRIDSDPFAARGFEAWMSVSGPGALTGDETNSEAVAADAGYWLSGNSGGLEFVDRGSNTYSFGDYPASGNAELVEADDILARFAFTWGGTAGWYTFAFPLDDFDNIDVAYSYISDEFWSEQAFQFSPGGYESDNPNSSFKVYIPEPATIILLALGSAVLLRKRNR